MSTLKNSLAAAALVATSAFGAAAPATAQDAGSNDNIRMAALQNSETVDYATARSRSEDRVILHVGEGFPDIAVQALANILVDRGYPTNILKGGNPNAVTLCLGGKCLGQQFDMTNAEFIVPIVEENFDAIMGSKQTNQPSF